MNNKLPDADAAGSSKPLSTITLPNQSGDPSNGNTVDYLHTIIDSLQDELLVIDKSYHVVEANAPFLSRHAKTRQDLIGLNCYEISNDSIETCFSSLRECPIKSVFDYGKSFHMTKERTLQYGGKERTQYVDIVASPIFSKNGQVKQAAILMRDMTEMKQLELRIAKAQENLSALNKIASAVAKSLDLDTVLNSALETTLEIMQCRSGGIMLLDEEGKTLSYRVYRGLQDKYTEGKNLNVGEGIAGKAVQKGHSIIVGGTAGNSRAGNQDVSDGNGLPPFISVPLVSNQKILGAINITSNEYGKLSVDSIPLLESIAAQIVIAIDNARLHQEVQQKEIMRGELLEDILSIQEEERRRIARELHDETSQVLASLAGNLEAATSMLSDKESRVKAILKKSQALSIEVLDETHRLIYELRPSLLDDMGLIAATRWLITNILEPAGVKVKFATTGTLRRLNPQAETTLFRVIQEAVNNISRHSEAKQASIKLQFKRNSVTVSIKDNGLGFDVEEAISSSERPRGLGLIGMRERVELIKGNLNIISKPGKGTEVIFEIPIKQEAAANG